MGMFKNREPRSYRPVNIYNDERKERLQKLIDEARRAKGEPIENEEEKKTQIEPDHFKGKFINYTPHLQRHKERSRRFGWPLWVLLLFVMIILWRFLLGKA